MQLPHLPHGPACHTRTLPSAIGLGQLCPPEIITSFLLLLLLVLLLQSPSPPRPRGGPSGISSPPSSALHPRSPQASFTLTEPPAPSSMSLLLLLVLRCGLGLARGGRGEVGVPRPRGWLLVQLEGAALLPAVISPASAPGCCCAPSSVLPGVSLLPGTGGSCPPTYNHQCPSAMVCPLLSAGIVLGRGAGPVPGSSPGTGPECLLWGGSWPTLPSHRAQGSGCRAALPSPPSSPSARG